MPLVPTGMAKFKSDHTTCWWGCGQGELSAAGGHPKWYICLEKRVAVPEKLNINLPYDEAIPFLGIYPRQEKAYVSTKTCSSQLKGTKPSSIYWNQQLREWFRVHNTDQSLKGSFKILWQENTSKASLFSSVVGIKGY